MMHKFRLIQPDGFWLIIFSAILWGTIGVTIQAIYNVDTTSSLFINLARLAIATPVLWIACRRIVGRTMFNIPQRDLIIMAISGVFLASSHAAYFVAIRYTGVTIATLLTICITPVAVSGLSIVLKLESLSTRTLIALGCALIGSVLLVGLRAPEGTDYNLLLGTGFSIISAVCLASMMICGRFIANRYHPLQVMTIAFSAGTLMLIPVNLISGVVIVHTAQGWLLVAYLGLIPTALAYLVFQLALRSVTATTASIISMLDPAVAALLAWVFFGETLAITGIAGAILLTLSIFILSMGKSQP